MNNIKNKGTQGLAKQDWMKEIEKVSGVSYEANRYCGTSILAIDCSGSMGGEKILLARKGAIDYAKSASSKGYQVGIVKFSSEAQVVCDPATQRGIFEEHVASIDASGSTNMAGGLDLSTKLLDSTVGAKIICLVTDGMPDNREEALSAAKNAKQKGIEIITIGTDDADKAFLAEIASRHECSINISANRLDEGIVSAVKMLP